MTVGPPLRRAAEYGATLIGVIALAAGVAWSYIPQSDAAASGTPLPELTALMDPAHGQTFALAFGDSYFVGSENVRAAQTFGRIALNDLGYSVAIRGHGATGYVTGSRIDGWPNYVSQIVDKSMSNLPDQAIRVILLEGGINDALVDAQPETVQINATWVMRQLRDRYPFATAVVLGVTPDFTGTLTGRPLAIDGAIRRAAADAHWKYLDARDTIKPTTVRQIIGPDFLHPTPTGHQMMAKALRESLIRAGVTKVAHPNVETVGR